MNPRFGPSYPLPAPEPKRSNPVPAKTAPVQRAASVTQTQQLANLICEFNKIHGAGAGEKFSRASGNTMRQKIQALDAFLAPTRTKQVTASPPASIPTKTVAQPAQNAGLVPIASSARLTADAWRNLPSNQRAVFVGTMRRSEFNKLTADEKISFAKSGGQLASHSSDELSAQEWRQLKPEQKTNFKGSITTCEWLKLSAFERGQIQASGGKVIAPTISRAEFQTLTPAERTEFCKNFGRITD